MIKLRLVLSMLFVSLLSFSSFAQIQGTVVDAGDQSPVIGASVVVQGTRKGTTTDVQGKFTLDAPVGSDLEISFIGYENVRFKAAANNTIQLKSISTALNEVVVAVGSRNTSRTLTDTPLPVDILPSTELRSTGQATFDKALQYRIPSFNTVNTPVNDATSLLDPYEIRNMGPSRTLILVNGKRKNLSSLVYIQTSPGRGETGADISAIPTDAIERVEILRDGASAQYGSDAIAGVMNIILKNKVDEGRISFNTGITGKGDGQLVGISVNNGVGVGQKGFLNYTINLSHQALANRSSALNAQDEADFWGVPVSVTQAYLSKMPDGGHVNGVPETTAAKFLVNGGVPVGVNSEVYFNAAYVYKKVNSFANYRVPYWVSVQDRPNVVLLTSTGRPEDYMGYVPTFEGDLNDYNGTLGFKSERNGWKTDVSFTTGGNKQLYTVNNTVNFSLGFDTPTSFKPGGYNFSHNVGNVDFSKALNDKVSIAFGSEFRAETFRIIGGDKASYAGGGANSFPGINQDFATTNTRYNLGGYVDLAYDVTKDFFLNGTFRTEQYSDFGNANVWKLSTRYKMLDDKLTFRASASTGFRAPTLHQIYLKVAQASFIDGTIKTSGLVPNGSKEANAIGVEKLTAEKSMNYTFGVGLKPAKNLNITLDYYNITVRDRIVLSSTIKQSDLDVTKPAARALSDLMDLGGISAIQFFTNGVDTRTSGIDFVANYRNLVVGKGRMSLNLAGNYMLENKLLKLNNPARIAAAGASIFDRTQEALMLTSRPKFKVIFGADYSIGKLGVNLNNTVFGPTRFRQGDLSDKEALETVFSTRMVTDLGFNYALSNRFDLSFNIQNLFNVLPKWQIVGLNDKGRAIVNDAAKLKNEVMNLTFNGRYNQVTYDGSHFSILGRMFAASLSMKL